MNERMERILTRGSEPDVLQVEIDPIAKPGMLSCSIPSIYIDGPYFFYTFDGRSLFFSREQNEPIISVPDETRDVCMINMNGVEYCFTLSLKNKLECLVNGPSMPDEKYCVTRNVLQVQKTGDRIYFIFRKDRLYFINECYFDGKKWIGKILHANIEGESVELFTADGLFFFVKDGRLCNARGDEMGIDADFAHKTGDIIVVGNREKHGYMFRIFDASVNEIDSILIPTMERGVIRAHQNVVVQQVCSDLYVMKVTKEGFAVSGCIRHMKDILCFDVKSHGDHARITLLTSEERDEQTFTIQGNEIPLPNADFESEESLNHADCDPDTSETNEGQDWGSSASKSNSPDNSDVDDGFFYDKDRKGTALKEIESMSLKGNVGYHPAHRPKNKLLEEVRATLSRRKQPETNASQNSSLETDRFAAYVKEEDAGHRTTGKILLPEPLLPGDRSFYDEHALSSHGASMESRCQDEKSPEDSSSSSKMPRNALVRKDKARQAARITNASKGSEGSPLCKMSSGAVANGLTLEQLLADHRRISLETQKETIAAVQSVIAKAGGMETMISDVIIKTLVPSVEACFNEMRIQILAEIRKLVSNVPGSTNPRATSIQKLISAGKMNQAIQEFMKLDESEMNATLDLFPCSSIENADSNILAHFVGKIFSLAKRQPKDVHFRLITACLLDIEVNDLTIESMQSMSVLLRHLKEMEELDGEKHSELNCLADIATKKIKKRARHHSSKYVQ